MLWGNCQHRPRLTVLSNMCCFAVRQQKQNDLYNQRIYDEFKHKHYIYFVFVMTAATGRIIRRSASGHSRRKVSIAAGKSIQYIYISISWFYSGVAKSKGMHTPEAFNKINIMHIDVACMLLLFTENHSMRICGRYGQRRPRLSKMCNKQKNAGCL